MHFCDVNYLFYRQILENPLNKNSYQKKFRIMMNVEELQMQVDIRRYDMTDVPMKKSKGNKRLLMLEVQQNEILLVSSSY
jgi:helicase MOV-10